MARSAFAVQRATTVLARTPLLPAEDLKNPSQEPDPLLAEGMFLASRQAGPAAGLARDSRDLSRLAITRRGYEVRARWRATPHGAFAGVAPAQFAGAAEAAGLRLGERHRARSNPGPAWLAAVCDQILADPDVLPLLTLTANNLVIRRGSRLEHEWHAATGEGGTQRITVRATDATVLIMSLCENGATARQVITEVISRWPVPEQVVRATLTGLLHGGFLLTDLLPGTVSEDPLGQLLGKLPSSHPLRKALARLRQLLADADLRRPGEPARLTGLTAARDLADRICFRERPLTVDVIADAQLVLPTVLADEAAAAAGALWQTSWDQDPLTAFHDQFLDRYGPRRFVPLLEVTDAAIGLGAGTDAPGTGINDPPARRTAVLASLLGQAAAQGQTEIVLDPATIAELAVGHAGQPPPRTTEICVRVIAASRHDLAAGRLRLAVCPGGSQDAGSTLGRFARLLPNATVGQTEAARPALLAEVAVRPRVPVAEPLAPPTGFAQWRIPVGVPARECDLVLDDLLLVSNGDHLLVWSARHDRQVVPVLYSRLTPYLLPPVARFLQLVGHSGCRPWHGWSWGPLAHSPFQPRVRYRRTVLAPARWVLPPTLTDAVRDQAAWDKALDVWRAETVPTPPDIAVTEDGDRMLPLDLRRPDDRELLRRYVRRGVRTITEQPGGPDAVQAVVPGPAGRHVLELLVPLARRAPAPGPARLPRTPARATGAGLYLPGGPWLSLAVRAPTTCHDEILLRLAALAADLAQHVDMWFWLRYANATHGPHLRVRFHGQSAALGGSVFPAVSAWGAELIRQRLSGGFTVEPYDQEIERYGGPDAIGAAESVFAADSRLVLTVLAAARDPEKRLMTAALSAVAVARTVADGNPAAVGGHHLDRVSRKRLAALRPQVRAIQLHDQAIPLLLCPAAVSAWAARGNALTTYHDTLKPAQRAACASALIHMHANRLLGNAASERIARALAADLLALPSAVP